MVPSGPATSTGSVIVGTGALQATESPEGVHVMGVGERSCTAGVPLPVTVICGQAGNPIETKSKTSRINITPSVACLLHSAGNWPTSLCEPHRT